MHPLAPRQRNSSGKKPSNLSPSVLLVNKRQAPLEKHGKDTREATGGVAEVCSFQLGMEPSHYLGRDSNKKNISSVHPIKWILSTYSVQVKSQHRIRSGSAKVDKAPLSVQVRRGRKSKDLRRTLIARIPFCAVEPCFCLRECFDELLGMKVGMRVASEDHLKTDSQRGQGEPDGCQRSGQGN